MTELAIVSGFIFGLIIVYFIGSEQVARYNCKMGRHKGHIKNGKLVCHTCFEEI